jgi:hypothetical protein
MGKEEWGVGKVTDPLLYSPFPTPHSPSVFTDGVHFVSVAASFLRPSTITRSPTSLIARNL